MITNLYGIIIFNNACALSHIHTYTWMSTGSDPLVLHEYVRGRVCVWAPTCVNIGACVVVYVRGRGRALVCVCMRVHERVREWACVSGR